VAASALAVAALAELERSVVRSFCDGSAHGATAGSGSTDARSLRWGRMAHDFDALYQPSAPKWNPASARRFFLSAGDLANLRHNARQAGAVWTNSSPNVIAYTHGIAASITAPKCIISHGHCSAPASKSGRTASPLHSVWLCRQSRISAIFRAHSKCWHGLQRASASPDNSHVRPVSSRGKQKVRGRHRKQNHPRQSSSLCIVGNAQRMKWREQQQRKNNGSQHGSNNADNRPEAACQ